MSDVTVVVAPAAAPHVVVTEQRAPQVTVSPRSTGGSVTTENAGASIVEEIDVVGIKGDKGEQGEKGAQGEQGPPGVSAINPVKFVQDVPASVWTIVHNLNTYPLVTVVDSANNTVLGDILYVDANTVTISFSAAFSGTAYII